MPLSKEDSRRAAALLEEFCAQLQACDDPGHVATLRATIEMLRSDLFLQLVDIQRDHYNEVKSNNRHGELLLKQDPAVTADFCHRYGISVSTMSLAASKEDNEEQKLDSSDLSTESEGNKQIETVQIDEQWDTMSPDPVLARAQELLRDDDLENERTDAVLPLKTSTPMGGQLLFMNELMQRTSRRKKSLDEMQPYEESSFSSVLSRTDDYSVSQNGHVNSYQDQDSSTRPTRKDSLYFLRHEESLKYVQQAYQIRHQRQAKFVKGPQGVGLSIVGSAHTGVFVKDIFAGGPAQKEGTLMKGDQILAINGKSAENMSYTDAAAIIKEISAGGDCSLVVVQNPSVWAEYEKAIKKQQNP